MSQGIGSGPPQGGGQGRGKMGGASAAGPGGVCACPKCGHKEPHVVGQPCNRNSCPKCGAVMIRS